MKNSDAVVEAAVQILYWESQDSAKTLSENQHLAQRVIDAVSPHILAEVDEKLQTIRELHAEDLFRGHLSNGCKTCGNVGDIGYPCPTILALDS